MIEIPTGFCWSGAGVWQCEPLVILLFAFEIPDVPFTLIPDVGTSYESMILTEGFCALLKALAAQRQRCRNSTIPFAL